jgi:hypothetical protein
MAMDAQTSAEGEKVTLAEVKVRVYAAALALFAMHVLAKEVVRKATLAGFENGDV